MNLKATGLVLLALAVFGVAGCSDDIDTKVDDVEESIDENIGNETWTDFNDPDCPRFDALEDGEQITCTATAVDDHGTEAPATVVATVDDCHEGPGDDSGRRCDSTNFDWRVDEPATPSGSPAKPVKK